MCLAQGPQRSDASEARTRYPSVSSQALYHSFKLYAEKVAIKKTKYHYFRKLICQIGQVYTEGVNLVAVLQSLEDSLGKLWEIMLEGSTYEYTAKIDTYMSYVNTGEIPRYDVQ